MTTSHPALSRAALWPALGRRETAALAAALVAFAATLFAPQVLNDGDTYWHLAAGAWMLDHGQVPHVDVFSFPHAGQPWDSHEWLSEVVMALAFRAAGWNGLLLLFAAAAAATAALVARQLGRSLGGLILAVVLAAAGACMAPSLLARPHLLLLPVMVIWTIELLGARDASRAPGWWFAPFMLAWANLHGSYVFGLLLYGVFALEAVVAAGRAWPAPLRSWGGPGVACALASCVTPHGLNAFVYPFQIMTMHTLGAIGEWRPADFSRVTPFALALFAALYVTLSRGVRMAPIRAAALLFLLYMGLQHNRHQVVVAALAPLILAAPLADALGHRPAASRGGRAALGLFAVAAVALASLRLALPVSRTDDAVTPAAALAHLPPGLAARPVINSYGFGGYLIFRGVKPFIDGRSDMYGDDHFARFLAIRGGDLKALDAAVRRYGVAWTLLEPDEPLVAALDAAPGWRRLYADRYAVVHVRGAAPVSAPPPPR
jgi:hypothetical protein